MMRNLEECDMETAECLMLLHEIGQSAAREVAARSLRTFQCKTCGKKFPTFQSLGGHRASHNKPRLSLVAGDDASGPDKENRCVTVTTKKRKRHTCPICGLEFDKGQALGGHMRKHRSEADGKRIVLKSNAEYKSSIPEKIQRCDDVAAAADFKSSNPEKIQRCDDVAAAADFKSSNLKCYQFDDANADYKNSHGKEKDHEEESDLSRDSAVPVFKTSSSKRVLDLDLNLTPSENFMVAKNYHL